LEQHLAASSPNVEILRDFLGQGASVHLRNRAGNTPLFLAAAAGLKDHVQTLMDAGAHLHSEEVSAARLHAGEAEGRRTGEGAGEGEGEGEGEGRRQLWEQVIGGGAGPA
jgi:ankyrin repeat protein